MAYNVTFELGAFNGLVPANLLKGYLEILVNTLFLLDVRYLQEHPETPLLYRSGVFYLNENKGIENWRDVEMVLAYGNGDCEDLAAFRAAELVVREGIQARPRVTFEETPQDILFHVDVLMPDGSIEDPSRILGMK